MPIFSYEAVTQRLPLPRQISAYRLQRQSPTFRSNDRKGIMHAIAVKLIVAAALLSTAYSYTHFVSNLRMSSASSKYQKTEPARFAVKTNQLTDLVFASGALAARLGAGTVVDGYKVSIAKDEENSEKYSIVSALGYYLKEDNKMTAIERKLDKSIVIYEFESCPFCKKVREAVTILDLNVLFKPCPRGGVKHRQEVVSKGGKSQFPFLVDENTGEEMYESDDIIKYLYETYGGVPADKLAEEVPSVLSSSPVNTLSLGVASLLRMGKGSSYAEARAPAEPLVLWGYEASPFVKLVRERLCELEIPYTLVPCARSSKNRDLLVKSTGRFQVPYLEDANTGVNLFESSDILDYINEVYSVGYVPSV